MQVDLPGNRKVTSTPKTNRIALLDALRGVTAIGVAAFHAFGFRWQGDVENQYNMPILGIFIHYWSIILVPTFYWISGFVVSYTSSDRFNVSGIDWSFLLRRFIKVTPIWWISIVFSVVFEAAFDLKHGSNIRWPSLVDVVANATFLNFVFDIDSLNYPGYSLCLEVQMYVLTFIIFTIGNNFSSTVRNFILPIQVLICGLLCSFLNKNVDGLAWLTSSFPWFALGFLCHLRSNRLISSDWTVCSAISMILSTMSSKLDDRWFVTISAVIAFSLLGELDINHQVWKVGRRLRHLGSISFPLYLLHIKFVAHAITFDKARAYLGLPPNATFFLIVLLPLLLAIAITPLMNSIDKLLMSKLFPRKVASGK